MIVIIYQRKVVLYNNDSCTVSLQLLYQIPMVIVQYINDSCTI